MKLNEVCHHLVEHKVEHLVPPFPVLLDVFSGLGPPEEPLVEVEPPIS